MKCICNTVTAVTCCNSEFLRLYISFSKRGKHTAFILLAMISIRSLLDEIFFSTVALF